MPAYAKAWLPSRAFFMIKSCVYWIYKIYFDLWSSLILWCQPCTSNFQ
jgi:hypothetical protein